MHVENYVQRIKALLEKYPDKPIPYEESLVLSHEFILELVTRVLDLEEEVY